MRTIIITCILSLLFCVPAAFAEEQPPDAAAEQMTLGVDEGAAAESAAQPAEEEAAEPETLKPVVVSATKIETPISKLGVSTTVITKNEIEQQGTTEVLEVLRNVPGVNIIQNGPKGSTAHVFMRGGESDFTMIMIDGVKLNDDGGLFDLAHLSTENVERIEIIRGPQSALYGADAMTGVINIITSKGEGPPKLTVSTEAGTHDTFRERVSLSGSESSMNYSLSASYFDTANLHSVKNDRYENTWLSGRVGFDLDEDTDLSLIATYQNSESGNAGPTDALPEDGDDRSKNRQFTFALNFDQYLKDWWEHVFQFSYFDQAYKNADPSVSFTTGDPFDFSGDDFVTDYTADINRVALNYQHNFYVGDDYVASIGGEWMEEEGNIFSMSEFFPGFPSITEIDETRINRALFAQLSAEFCDRLNVVAGVRYDDNSSFGTEISPRVAASYRIKETNTRLKGSYGEGIKNPSFFDLFDPFFGNPDLGAEESKSWDVGVEQNLTLLNSDVTLGLTYFDQDFTNLIQFVGSSIENFGNSVARGIETEIRIALPCDLTVVGAYTYLIEAEYRSEPLKGRDLLRRPKHLAAVTLNYNRGKWNANLNATYTGSRPEIDPITFAAGEEADDFTKVDVAVSYQLNEHVQLIGLVENLLDENVAQSLGYESTGISFLGGVRGVF